MKEVIYDRLINSKLLILVVIDKKVVYKIIIKIV